MRSISFVVPGKCKGYTTTNRNGPKSKAILAYWEYCKAVRLCAAAAGVRPVPLVSTREAPIMIFTRAYFASGVHADPENIHKGIKDALFYSKKIKLPKGVKWTGDKPNGTADKYTGGAYLPPLYDKQNPRVEVLIRPFDQQEDEYIWHS